MKKLIISLAFTITLPLFQVAVAQGTEIPETISDTDINEIEQNICNNLEVLLNNQPYKTVLNDGTLVVNSSGNYTVETEYNYYGDDDDDDDDDDDGGSGVTPTEISATEVDLSIMEDPSDTRAQDEVNCLPT